MCPLNDFLCHKRLVLWAVGSATTSSVDWAQYSRFDALRGLDPVPAIVLLEINSSQPWVSTYATVIRDDVGVVDEGDGAGGWEFLLDSNECSPVEGLNVGAFIESTALKDGDDVVDVGLEREGFVGDDGVEFGLRKLYKPLIVVKIGHFGFTNLQVDLDLAIAIALDQIKNLLQGLDLSSRSKLCLLVTAELHGAAVKGLQFCKGDICNEFPNEVASCVLALGTGDLMVVPNYGLYSAFTGQLNYLLSI